MRVLFLRHAQSVAQLDPSVVIGRCHDAPLSPLGLEQAAIVARRVARLGDISRVFTSTCVRAVQTAEPVAAALGLPLEPTDLLVERSHGEFEGVKKDLAYSPEIVARIHADQWRWKPAGGESLEEVGGRLRQFFEVLRQLPQDKGYLAVSHQMVMWSLFRLCTGCDHAMLPRLPLNNAALVEIHLEDGTKPQLVRWNYPLLDNSCPEDE